MSEAHAIKEKAALASIFASAFITLAKLVAGLLSGSLALLSEAGHALVDTGATIVTYFAVKAAHKPADDKHHYGHGKVESLAALVETGLLFALAAYVLFEAIHRLSAKPAEVEVGWLAFGVLIVSIVIDLFRWRALSKIAKETKSDALAADALHFSSDLLASVLVLIGLIATYFGFLQGDAIAALGVAVFIAIVGYKLARQTLDTLLDVAPEGMADKIRAAVENTPGVVSVETLRLRPAGPNVLGDLEIFVPRTMPVERIAKVKEQVRAAIATEVPEAQLTLAAHPKALDDETILERVHLIAARKRLPIHHVTVQHVDERFSVSFDLELDGHMTLGEAHEVASALETDMEDELGAGVEVETHVEPLEAAELTGSNAPEALRAAVLAGLARRAADNGIVQQVHNVRVRETPAGLVVNYHCRLDPALSVDAMHEAVDKLDRAARTDFPAIVRIVGHAEPIKGAPRA